MAASLQTAITERLFLAAAGALGLIFATIAYQDYRYYVSLGPHGLPDTFWGWYTQLKMSRKSRKDVTVPVPYDIKIVAGPHDQESYLPQDAVRALKWRPGNKMPRIPNFVAPQRQVSDQASDSMKQAMFAYLDTVVASHRSVLQTQKSVLEGPVPAVGIKDFKFPPEADRPNVIRATRGEIIHIHPPDGSTHMVMSLADQKSVIELGWGRRHRLSGGGMLPWNYTFVYAPRNEAEFEVWKVIIGAAVKFCIANIEDAKKSERSAE
ncbi:hypothetical protein N0V90_012447 [Kalmusia sp. IMI 367209]|nr:hypothetical protein N0V90_012447 [Kalmusia sp. IMI 367209]